MKSKIAAGFLVGTAIAALMAGMPQAKAQTANSQSNSNSASGATADSASRSAATSGGGSAGAQINQTYNNAGQNGLTYGGGTNNYSSNRNDGDVTVRTTPTVYAPPVSGGNPCTLAVSGGVSVIGWGAAAGGTFVDEACATRQKIAMVHNAGYRGAAKELMCDDRATYVAFKTAGEPCNYRAAFEPPGMAAQPMPPMVQTRPVAPPVIAPVAEKQYPRCDARRGITDNCRS